MELSAEVIVCLYLTVSWNVDKWGILNIEKNREDKEGNEICRNRRIKKIEGNEKSK